MLPRVERLVAILAGQISSLHHVAEAAGAAEVYAFEIGMVEHQLALKLVPENKPDSRHQYPGGMLDRIAVG
jgi:hypothetical protein